MDDTNDEPAHDTTGPRVVLASASPRRIELLSSLGLVPTTIPADVDESRLPGESAPDYVLRVATDKAHAVSVGAMTPIGDVVVVAADTSVVVDGRVIGKPVDDVDAARTLRLLAGRSHEVLSAVVVMDPDGVEHSSLSSTRVTFAELDDAEIAWYVDTGEPRGKAGSYAIQGLGGFMVESIDGAPSTVIGLPLRPTIELLRMAGVDVPAS